MAKVGSKNVINYGAYVSSDKRTRSTQLHARESYPRMFSDISFFMSPTG